MKYIEQTGQSIHQAFQEFHKDNPRVYRHFMEYFFDLHNRRSWQRVSGKLIIERIRWEILVTTNDPDFKINNNFTAHYVRLFISDYPHYKKCFVLRELKS